MGLLKTRLTVAEQQVQHRLEAKRAAAELARSHEDVLFLLNTALTDSDGCLTCLNHAAHRLFFGDAGRSLVGCRWDGLFAFEQSGAIVRPPLAFRE